MRRPKVRAGTAGGTPWLSGATLRTTWITRYEKLKSIPQDGHSLNHGAGHQTHVDASLELSLRSHAESDFGKAVDGFFVQDGLEQAADARPKGGDRVGGAISARNRKLEPRLAEFVLADCSHGVHAAQYSNITSLAIKRRCKNKAYRAQKPKRLACMQLNLPIWIPATMSPSASTAPLCAVTGATKLVLSSDSFDRGPSTRARRANDAGSGGSYNTRFLNTQPGNFGSVPRKINTANTYCSQRR